MKNTKPAIQRFISYVRIDPFGCWIWSGSLNIHGYGQFHDQSRQQPNIHAFRWAYEYFKGPLPVGHEPDHLCRIRSCVNPEHLEAVTKKENILRGVGATAINARKTQCNNGHSEWGRAGRKGGRRCLACHRINELKRLEKIRHETTIIYGNKFKDKEDE